MKPSIDTVYKTEQNKFSDKSIDFSIVIIKNCVFVCGGGCVYMYVCMCVYVYVCVCVLCVCVWKIERN